MKLVMAVVGNDDSAEVAAALTKDGFSVTKLATTGGFLKSGNTTFIVGTDDDKVDQVIDIISKQSRRRTQLVPNTTTMDMGMYSGISGRSHRGRFHHFRAERGTVRKSMSLRFDGPEGGAEIQKSLSLAFAGDRFPTPFFWKASRAAERTGLPPFSRRAAVCLSDGE